MCSKEQIRFLEKLMNSLMKLKVYSESDSDDEINLEERLPLPDFFGSSANKKFLFNEVNEKGKCRNFPHEPGNWATYVYIPMNSSEFESFLNALLIFFKPLDLKLSDDFHISLTRTVILRHHWIPDFISSIKNSISEINSFKIHLHGLKAYTNDQKTRSFLSLKVETGEEDLLFIVSCLKKCFRDYNLEGFYENPSFHLSLLWCPGNKCSEINKYIDLLSVKLKNFDFYNEISCCICATGNKKFTFNFG